jgi:hypothetical protein
LIFAFIILIFAACATVNQRVILAPVSADFPVSASRTLMVDGNVIGEDNILDSKAFSIEKKVKIPLIKKEANVDFTPDLKGQLAGTDYKGVTQLKVTVDNIDSSATSWITIEQDYGILFAFLGGALIALDPPTSGSPNINNGAASSGLLVPGAIMAGAGVALFGGSLIHRHYGTVEYALSLSGMKVKY